MTTHCFTVLKKNGLCSIQDLGRPASQHLGFTAGGAADEYAFLAANYLVGNLLTENHNNNTINSLSALEITLGQLSLKVNNHCTMAITGAECNTTINDKAITNWQVHSLKPNDIITFSTPKRGLHCYLAVKNGIKGTPWLNSQSQSLSEVKLGFTGGSINVGSVINFSENSSSLEVSKNKAFQVGLSTHFYKHFLNPKAFTSNAPTQSEDGNKPEQVNRISNEPLVLRFLPHPLWYNLTTEQQQKFTNISFTISPQSNRMGYRLSNLPSHFIESLTTSNQLSMPVCFGTIQLPSNGHPIVLMKERQTIGGYPTIGCVIQTDLFKLSQLRPGEMVQFEPTNLTFAQQQINAMYLRFST